MPRPVVRIVARWAPVPAKLDEMLAAFERLVREHWTEPAEVPAEGEGNFRCDDCVACRQCRFCRACERCDECTYCEECVDCRNCTQCRQCSSCERTSHSELAAECIAGSYLTLCLGCERCVHCFGCVGLVDEEFCLLNEKLGKSDYFRRVAELREPLAALIAKGWTPPWFEPAAPEPVVPAMSGAIAVGPPPVDAERPFDADLDTAWPELDPERALRAGAFLDAELRTPDPRGYEPARARAGDAREPEFPRARAHAPIDPRALDGDPDRTARVPPPRFDAPADHARREADPRALASAEPRILPPPPWPPPPSRPTPPLLTTPTEGSAPIELASLMARAEHPPAATEESPPEGFASRASVTHGRRPTRGTATPPRGATIRTARRPDTK
jgi:hypothetical protein